LYERGHEQHAADHGRAALEARCRSRESTGDHARDWGNWPENGRFVAELGLTEVMAVLDSNRTVGYLTSVWSLIQASMRCARCSAETRA